LRETLRVWELGEAFLVAVPFEAYSHLQKDVRAAAKGRPVFVLNTSNAFCGYIPPAPLYQIPEIYSVWQTPYGQGSAEAVSRLACQSLQ
jgi:hypothetical protein